MTISLIACVDKNNAIGNKQQLLCYLPNDLAHFKKHTQGNIICMGRKTFESIGKMLPNRHNIILSRQKTLDVPPGVYVYHSVEDVLREYESYSNKEAKLYIIGGSKVYNEFLPYADKIILTIVDHKFEEVDTYFPRLTDEWKPVETIKNEVDDMNPYDHYFVTYEKRFNNK